MEKTLVIIDKSGAGNYSRVAIKNQIKDEWAFNAVVHNSDIAQLIQETIEFPSYISEEKTDLQVSFATSQKETLIMMQASHPCFIELKNKRYKIKTVTL